MATSAAFVTSEGISQFGINRDIVRRFSAYRHHSRTLPSWLRMSQEQRWFGISFMSKKIGGLYLSL